MLVAFFNFYKSLICSHLECAGSVLAKIGGVLTIVLVSVLADFLKSL